MTQVTEMTEKQMAFTAEELGGTGLQQSGGRIHEEFLRQLSGTLRNRVFSEMSSNDPIIRAVLYAIEMMVKQVSWDVEPGGPDTEDERKADLLRSIPEDMSHSWSAFLGEWMAAPVYGYAPFEIVWKRRAGPQRRPGLSSRFDDGMVGVRKLAIRHPETLDHWEMDDEGGVEAMVQRPQGLGKGTVTIPIDKLLLFTVLQRKGSPEGMSLIRGAYVPWYRKKKIEQIEAIGIERDLAGLPFFTVPPEWAGPNATDEHKALYTEIKKMGRNLRKDEQAAVILPAIYDEEGNKTLDFELVSTGGRRAIDTAAPKEYYSRQIAMTVLADVILIGHEQVGSFALADSKTNLFAAGIGALLDEAQDTLNRHLVPRLMRLNGLGLENMPEFRHGDIEDRDLGDLAEFIERVARAGFPLFPTETQELEREILRIAGLPFDDPAFQGEEMV